MEKGTPYGRNPEQSPSLWFWKRKGASYRRIQPEQIPRISNPPVCDCQTTVRVISILVHVIGYEKTRIITLMPNTILPSPLSFCRLQVVVVLFPVASGFRLRLAFFRLDWLASVRGLTASPCTLAKCVRRDNGSAQKGKLVLIRLSTTNCYRLKHRANSCSTRR